MRKSNNDGKTLRYSFKGYPFDYVIGVFETFLESIEGGMNLDSEDKILTAITTFSKTVLLKPSQCRSLLKYYVLKIDAQESQAQKQETNT